MFKRSRTAARSFRVLFFTTILLLVPALALQAQAEGTTIFINEIHYDNVGTDADEAVEIAGPAGTDLVGWTMVFYNGSGGAEYARIELSGLIPDEGDGYGALAFTQSGIQNGSPDGIALVDPGDIAIQFLSYEGSFTAIGGPADGLISVDIGVTEPNDTPLGESLQLTGAGTLYEDFVWNAHAASSFGALNTGQSFSGAPPPTPTPEPPEVLISEIRIDQDGTDNDEFFELVGPAGASLDGLTYLVIGDGTDGSGVIENVTDLGGAAIPASGYFVAAESTFTLGTADLVTNLNFENSDNVTHLLVQGFTGSNGDDLDSDDDGVLDVEPWAALIDLIALVEEENPPVSTEFHYGPPTVGPDGSYVPGYVFRCEDGFRIGPFTVGGETPGAENNCFFGFCGEAATPIHAIQGDGDASPLVGQVVVAEGVVVADFQGYDGLHGFFLQEEIADEDGDPATSEGIFVYDGSFGVDVAYGDVVRVQAAVSEYYNLTELSGVSSMSICDTGYEPVPAELTLPAAEWSDFERLEGMLVTLPQSLTVTGNYAHGRYGEVDLSVDGRLFTPTNVTLPGDPANDLQAANNLRKIQLDDGSSVENPLPLPPYLIDDTTLRAGDMVSSVTGALGYAYGLYEIHPVLPVELVVGNERPAAAPDTGGRLTVASFNVLNYFTTIDEGNPICGPEANQDCRGADSVEEFIRQRDKIVNAIALMDADVVGLIELENNASESLADLVAGLNDVMGAGTYAYVDTGTIGTDAIKVGFLYQPANVTPIGDFAVLDSSFDPSFNDEYNRPALAQTFAENLSGESFTVVVNHFKSKGSACDDIGDPDIGDGQGNCNLTRTSAAIALSNWI